MVWRPSSALTYFCDRTLMAGESTHDERLRREWDPATQIPAAVRAINSVVDGLEAELGPDVFLRPYAHGRRKHPRRASAARMGPGHADPRRRPCHQFGRGWSGGRARP